jgi:cytochrome c556
MKLAALAFAGLMALMMSGCASTDENRSARQSTSQTIVNEKGEVTHVCHNEKSTGSRVGNRVCRSVEQTARDRDAARAEAARMQRSGMTAPIGG